MCLQISYTLTCEHVKTQMIYCADAIPVASSSSSSSSKKEHKSHKKDSSSSKKKKSASSSSSSSSSHRQPRMIPCDNLTQQSLPYPTPPSFTCDPQTAATSLLAPKCPLTDCPFEAKDRCWNCCWCGKGWNERGRCSCIMIIEGNRVQCEHICCSGCEAAKR
ncbi:uncharacterized protein SPSK_10809 [Sporothrix schenckii 1099-18]|uniref:Uncharacterized protein n=1 Tax=Sporothrix schenckii 1099-18 TaxID=1397361 RepID=A0A0F2MF16_SPOSC|nr:uncharacterized protein SPSK_10809 [Sporothrix schenckii 1099-18]KJR87669.1 hypothetical protein SPSK_10809 [Sporothrix schenckii 1099-18]